ncbi:hypothetical protein Sjap_015565 [Stephania japonica]|uniref:Protein ENHANCED DISEASE RESISTANCE 2 C-terminal domain-containing protein n=1 Tax=Stephania japonica TaxID=461633 RepID=A0AAP0NRH3_9MAGN
MKFMIMGGCVSTTSGNGRVKSQRKHPRSSSKYRGKIPKPLPGTPKKRISDVEKVTDFAVSEFVRVDYENGATTTCTRSEVANSTFHLTQLQWHHSQIDANDCFPSIGNVIGNGSSTQMLQCENASLFLDTRCQYGEYYESTPKSFALERYLKIDSGNVDTFCKEEYKTSIVKTKITLQDSLGSFNCRKDNRTQEKIQDNNLKSLLPHLLPTVSFNDKNLAPTSPVLTTQMTTAAVLRLSFKRKSCDGEETAEICKVSGLLCFHSPLPTYPATMFLGDNDGEGMSLVLYFKLSETFEKDVSPCFQASIQGFNYFEIDLDIHRFSYISRKGLEAFRERLKDGILDLGLTIQAQKQEELPEEVLCCVRLNKIDFVNHGQIPTIVTSNED